MLNIVSLCAYILDSPMRDWFDTTMWHSTWPPVLCECAGSRMTSRDWFLLSVLGTCCTKNNIITLIHEGFASDTHLEAWPCYHAATRLHLHFILALISALCVVTPRGHVNGGRLCEVAVRMLSENSYLYPIFHFSFQYSAWPPYASILICPSTMVHGYMWGCAAYSTERRPLSGIIMQKMNAVKLCSWISQLWFYWCFGPIVYCLQKSRLAISDTLCSQAKARSEKQLFHDVLQTIMWGQQHLNDL